MYHYHSINRFHKSYVTADIASDANNFAKLNFVAQRQFKSPLTKYNELQPILLFAREAGIFTGPHLFNIENL